MQLESMSGNTSAVQVRPLRWRARRRRGRLSRVADFGSIWLAALLAILGIFLDHPWLVASATCLLGLRFAVRDVASLRGRGLSPVALAAIGVTLTGLADTVGLWSMTTNPNSPYNIYADEQHLLLASVIALVGWTAMIVGMLAATGRRTWRPAILSLPSVRGRIGDRGLIMGGAGLSILAIAATFADSRPQLGTVYSLFLLSPLFATFTLARAGYSRRVRGATATALGIALAASAHAMLFAYLRAEALSPLIAFALGALVGGRSLSPFRSKYFIPIYVAGVLFVIYFRAFGEIRASHVTSIERVTAVYEHQDVLRQEDDEAAPALLRRLTSFNQLSQVGRLVQEDGFLGGATLDYLSYSFIPRFLWPDKPKIAKGSWFAVRIGHGYQLRDGTYSNAVNMTVPGELYLNFGWPGVVLGSAAFGLLIGLLWTKTQFWTDPRNTVGTAFGFYLLWNSLRLGSDLQIGVTLIAMYLLFIGISGGVGLLRQRRSFLDGRLPPRASPKDIAGT